MAGENPNTLSLGTEAFLLFVSSVVDLDTL